MPLCKTFREGMEGAITDPTLCHALAVENLTVNHPDAVLLDVAQAALRGCGLDVGSLSLDPNTAAYGSFSTMRVLRDASDPDSPYAMIMQRPLPMSTAYLGTAGMYLGPGPSLHTFHGAESLVKDCAVHAGVNTPKVFAFGRDHSQVPAFTFSIQEYVQGVVGNLFMTNNPAAAPEIARLAARELVKLHALEPDIEGYGYFHREAADQGYLMGVYPSARDHYMAALGPTLLHSGLSGDDVGAVTRFFLTSPALDLLGRPPRVLHGDFGPHNIIVRDGDGMPSVIDYAFTLAGPVEYDLATVEETMGVLGLRQYWPEFFDAYQNAGGVLVDEWAVTYGATRLRMALSRVGASSAIMLDATADVLPALDKLRKDNLAVIQQEADKLGIRLDSIRL